MSRRLFASLLVLIVALALPASALAQDYLFSVDRELVDVYWNSDGTESIEYTWDFTAQPGSHAIEYVDVGMPNGNFDMSTASAEVNGSPVSVSKGDYQGDGTGFAVVLGPAAIQPGKSGSVHVYVGRITGVVYPDSKDDNYASGVFIPTNFGSQYVVGNTDMRVTFHLPPGVKPEEPRYHPAEGWPGSAEPQAAIDNDGRITYTWASAAASAAGKYTFGASFPRSYIPADAIVTQPAFDFTGIISAIIGNLGSLACCGFFAFMFVGMPIIGFVQGQRRKLQYIPPRIGIEGHGIKRGLTAVEAAVLMEQPLDKVMTMILFGAIKKGAARVTSRDPLKIQASEPLPDGLQEYEKTFLNAMGLEQAPARQKALQDMMVALVKSVGEKMKGFSRKETQEYYKNIMEQAWAQVEAAQTPEVKSEKIEQNLEWTMLDRDYDDRSRRVFTGPIFYPMWWGNYDPSYRPISTGGHAGPAIPTSSAGLGTTALPGADLAASVVGGVQTFSGKVLGDINAFTSRVTNVTNPPPPPSKSTYRGGGGGHSCACACACAGCACACAGGGR